jgi:hypothetical protein
MLRFRVDRSRANLDTGAVTKPLLAAVLLSLVVLAAGCGKSKPKTATDWANGVCSAVSTWTTSLGDAADSLKNGNVTKDSVKSAANDAQDATDELRSDLKKLGKPNTDSGGEAQDTVNQLSDQINDGVSTIEDTVKNVSSLSGVLSAVTTVSSTLTTMKNEVTAAYQKLSSLNPGGELQQAFQQAPDCASFRG